MKQKGVLSGSDIADLNIAERPEWKIGDFVKPTNHPFNTDKFALKWAYKKPGDKKPDGSKAEDAHTVTILIRGKFKMIFPDTNEEILMTHEGEYVYFAPGVNHTWECIEDTFIITLRWPK